MVTADLIPVCQFIEQAKLPLAYTLSEDNCVDIMAQNYLIDELGVDPSRVIIYHMSGAPRNANPKVEHTIGAFNSDEERDAAMTYNSSQDIAFVADHTVWSGTAQNILRRHLL